MKYNEYVIKSILSNNQFGITIVNHIETLKSIFFVREEYTVIEGLILRNDFEAIKQFSQAGLESGEYLEIMSFIDQRDKVYTVTIYDSNALEQDPQVIEIYP